MSSTDSLSLSNKVVIITGSGKENGIGAAIALTFARSGARVTINYVSYSSASRAAKVLSTIESAKAEDIMKTFQVAVVGPVLLLQAAYPHIPRGGRIVNIGSVASKLGFVQMPIYAAAKAALDQLTFTLAREIGRDGKNITVNTVAPGPMLTDSLPPVPEVEPVKNYLMSLTRAEEIADAVLLLTSEKSRWITGQFISVSGGINGG